MAETKQVRVPAEEFPSMPGITLGDDNKLCFH